MSDTPPLETPSPSQWWEKFLGEPGLSGCFFVIACLVGLYGALLPVSLHILQSTDTPWLIQTGCWILEHHTVPHTNILAGDFTALQNIPFVAYQWLYEVILACFYKLWGLHGVAAISAIIFALWTLPAMHWLLMRGYKSFPHAFVSVLLGFIFLRIFWAARPFAVSIGMMASLLWLIEKKLSWKTKLVVFPLFFMLWANMHLAFPVGLLILLVYQGVEAWQGKTLKPLILVGVSALATAVNPYGMGLYQYLFALGNSSYMNANITELASFDFHELYPLVWLLITIASAVYCWQDKRIRPAEKILFFVFLGMMLFSKRHAYLFILISLPVSAAGLGSALGAIKFPLVKGFLDHFGERFTLDTEKPLLTVLVVSILCFFAASKGAFPAKLTSQDEPTETLAYLKQHPVKELILTDGKWGSILMFHTPCRSHLDTRFDMYGDAYVKKMIQAYRLAEGWQKTFAQEKIHYVLYPADAFQAKLLEVQYGWSPLVKGSKTVLLKSPS